MVDEPFHEFAHRPCPCLIVERPHHAAGLPGIDKSTLGDVPQVVIIGQVGHRRHILGHLVDQLVQRLDNVTTLADVESRQIFFQLLVELISILTHAGYFSLATSTRLEGEDDTSEGAVEEFVLIEGTYGNGHARHGDVGTHDGVAGDAVDRGTQGAGLCLVEDVAERLGNLLVAAAQLVGHLYLGQVEILRPSTQLLKGYGILEEGRFGGVDRWKPDSNSRTYGRVLSVLLGLVEIRPILQLFVFRFVVTGEVAANCFH